MVTNPSPSRFQQALNAKQTHLKAEGSFPYECIDIFSNKWIVQYAELLLIILYSMQL